MRSVVVYVPLSVSEVEARIRAVMSPAVPLMPYVPDNAPQPLRGDFGGGRLELSVPREHPRTNSFRMLGRYYASGRGTFVEVNAPPPILEVLFFLAWQATIAYHVLVDLARGRTDYMIPLGVFSAFGVAIFAAQYRRRNKELYKVEQLVRNALETDSQRFTNGATALSVAPDSA
jgi:hypothetical protein